MLYFEANAEKDKVALTWATASEINNDFFTIEKSRDGETFEPVAFVQSKATDGYSSNTIKYSYKDNDPLDGISYYRLKQTDFDGSYEYSPMVDVRFDQQQEDIFTIYPNPNRGNTFGLLSNKHDPGEKVSVTITNTSGRVVYQKFIHADENGFIDKDITPNSELNSGLYIVNISSYNSNKTGRLIVK